ncbi:MAG: hypothetical protein NZM94_03700 [Roseiflexus sp.]|nr:hypothetical protein [Roseiflexus sp.]
MRWDLDSSACTIRSTRPEWAAAPTRTFAMPLAQLPGYGAEGLALMRAFASAIRGEGQSGFTTGDAIVALRVIEAAREPARSGQATAPVY